MSESPGENAQKIVECDSNGTEDVSSSKSNQNVDGKKRCEATYPIQLAELLERALLPYIDSAKHTLEALAFRYVATLIQYKAVVDQFGPEKAADGIALRRSRMLEQILDSITPVSPAVDFKRECHSSLADLKQVALDLISLYSIEYTQFTQSLNSINYVLGDLVFPPTCFLLINLRFPSYFV